MIKVEIENGIRIVTIEKEPDKRCELCGEITETAPYGPMGEDICFECGMKDLDTTARHLWSFWSELIALLPYE